MLKLAPLVAFSSPTVGDVGTNSTVKASSPVRSQGGYRPSSDSNILVVWGGIGISNLSGCSLGLMGHHTPDIDRLGRERMLFTDSSGALEAILTTGH